MSSLSGKHGPRYRHLADETEPYETIGVEKLTPIIGAEISGVDIGKLVWDDARSNRQMDEIHRALAENLVIFFRDQHITPQQHLAFGRKFGDLHIHPAAPHEGDDPALMKIYADKDSPRANGEGWHTDVSCDVEPPMGSILYIRHCPPHAGLSLPARRKPAIPVPLPLDRKRQRVLGQPLRPTPRDVGLLAAHPRRHAGDGEGGAAGVSGRVDASPRLRQSPAKAKQNPGGPPCSAQKTTRS